MFRFSPYWVLVLGRGLVSVDPGFQSPLFVVGSSPLIVLGLVVGRGRIRGSWYPLVLECGVFFLVGGWGVIEGSRV